MAVTISGSGQIVKQVVSATNSTSQSTNSSSFVNSSLSATITPTSSSSKIFVTITFAGYDSGGAGVNWYSTIQRGTTNLGSGFGFGTLYNSAGGIQGTFAMSYLDSPSTTSATTYSFAFARGSGTAYLNFNGETSTITLMEISGA
jgi:hypothetical protein